MDLRTAIDLPIDIDGVRVRSETLQASLSPYVVTIGTTLPAHGLSLYSTYHGHPGAVTVVVHLTRAPSRSPTTESEERRADLLPVVFARARCLRDHAMRLQTLVEGGGTVAAVHLSDEAELAVESARAASTV